MLKKVLAKILLLLFFLFSTTKVNAQVSSWQKGATIMPNSTTIYSSDSFRQSLNNLKSANANFVTLIIPYYQDSRNSNNLYRGWNTPTDESLRSGINYAKSIGLSVMLKVHPEISNGEWRRYIEPSDKDTWFQTYGSILNYYADIASETGVAQICLGSETYNLTSHNHDPRNTQLWIDLISQVRSRFSGTLTYSAQHTTPREGSEIQFWDQLDYIGYAAYFPLATGIDEPTVDQLKESWSNWNSEIIAPLSSRWGRPVLFTEIGYRSVNGAHKEPAAWWRNDAVDMEEQSRDYEALFSFWNEHSFMQGIHWWEWEANPNAGGTGSSSYTPQNKPAQEVMAQWFGSGSSSNPGDPQSPQDFETSVSLEPASPHSGQNVTVTVNVKPQNNISSVIVDIEIYDSSGNKVFQRYLENKDLNSAQVSTFNVDWNPSNPGDYQLKLGIFASGWSSLYHWQDDLLNFRVLQSDSSTPDMPSNFKAVSSFTPSTPLVNQPVEISTDITPDRNLSNVIVDIELYNSSGNKVYQKVFDNQNLTQGQVTNFKSMWAPTQTGEYRLKVGVFENYWSSLIIWFDNVDNVTVDQSSTLTPTPTTPPATATPNPTSGPSATPTQTPSTPAATPTQNPVTPTPTQTAAPTENEIEVWWPSDGVTIGGTQPFKALLKGYNLSDYKMYWQVDDGQLNEMPDNNQDHPHKEILVDVSSWDWQGNGPYNLKFVAKDNQDNIIAEKTLKIYIAR
ncbi:MAG: glycoside hydrolase family 113 [Patescibacteria group bacterium]|jgi:hypothetical protein